MTPQEKASKEVEVAGWLKSRGYDRRTWQGMAKIIVDYLAEHPVKSVDLADVGKQRELLIAFKTWETENDIKNLKPDQLADFFLEDGNL